MRTELGDLKPMEWRIWGGGYARVKNSGREEFRGWQHALREIKKSVTKSGQQLF